MNAKKIAVALIVIGGAGYATDFLVGYVAAKQQATSTPTLPSWYTSTLGKVDNLTPGIGTFGAAALVGVGMLVYMKYGKKVL